VLPCLNEAETLGTCLSKAMGVLRDREIRGEVIVADNGSSDGSQDIATALGARVVTVNARGYGNALMGGIAAARGEFVVMGDADDSYDFLETGLVTGAAGVVFGVGLLGYSVNLWRVHGFGDLDYSLTMRWVIPGVTRTALGFQTILSSFLLSVLGLRRR